MTNQITEEELNKMQACAAFVEPSEPFLKLIAEVRRLREQKDGAYRERDLLVALLAKIFPAYLCRHPESDTTWDNDWRTIVAIELPTGQATWHIHDSEVGWFEMHLNYQDNNWDGHSTDEKYERVNRVDAYQLKELIALGKAVEAMPPRQALVHWESLDKTKHWVTERIENLHLGKKYHFADSPLEALQSAEKEA